MQVSENKGKGKYPKIRKINYFGEKQGVSENIGCPKTQSNYGITKFCCLISKLLLHNTGRLFE